MAVITTAVAVAIGVGPTVGPGLGPMGDVLPMQPFCSHSVQAKRPTPRMPATPIPNEYFRSTAMTPPDCRQSQVTGLTRFGHPSLVIRREPRRRISAGAKDTK